MSTFHDSLHSALISGSDIVLPHLWLSTILLAIALAIASLPRLSARTKYFVILIAVAKFAVPAALLVRMGEGARSRILAMLGWQRETLPLPVSFIFDSPVSVTAYTGTSTELACAVFFIWTAGTAAAFGVALTRRWSILRTVYRTQGEVTQREASIFANVCRSRAIDRDIRLCTTTATTAPAAVGVLRPAVLLPEGSSESLSDRELEGVLIHELAHIERRDNLTGLIQTLLSSIFWFHPLLWIANRRLLIERERACDEAVVESDITPSDYISGVLKICHGAAWGHPTAVACMRSAHLKERMDHVMRYEALKARLLSHRMVSITAAGLVLAATMAAASLSGLPAPPPSQAPPYSIKVSVIETKPGQYLFDIEVLNDKGTVILSPRMHVVGGEKGVLTSSSGTRELQITADLNERGNGPVVLEVREDGELVTYQTVFAMVRSPGDPGVADAAPSSLSLDVKDADLRDVLQTFSKHTGETFTLGPGLSGKVTIQVTDTPWPAALSAVLRPLGMMFVRHENEIRVVTFPSPLNRSGRFARVGGNIQPPRLIHRVEPVYTEQARKARVAGVVILETAIDAEGNVVDGRILKNLPFELGDGALAAVRQWKFSPAMNDGSPVPVLFNLTIGFRLEEDDDRANVIETQQGSGQTGVLRVGGDVKAPRVLSRVEPAYTPEARAARVQGVVILEAHIDATGRVAEVRVLKGLPHGLDISAADALRGWIFEPATLQGQPVPVLFNLTINFKLDDEVRVHGTQ